MTDLFEEIKQQVVLVLMLLIPAIGAALVAWVKSKQRKWEQDAVKQAVREVDDSAFRSNYPPTGRQKHQEALAKLRVTAPGLKPERASQMIEAVLPVVREESERPPPTLPSVRP
jgi:hypothetical protein